jgi:hypothetical protein
MPTPPTAPVPPDDAGDHVAPVDTGAPLPQRRVEDTKSYAGEWTVLLTALLTWATTFCFDMAETESLAQVLTLKFMALHVGQLFAVTTAIVSAKRIR